MFCRKCGTPIKPESRFCPACGEAMRGSLSVPPQRPRSGLDRADLEPAFRVGRAMGARLSSALSRSARIAERHWSKVVLGFLLLAFVFAPDQVGVLAGVLVLIISWRKQWWYAFGGLLGLLLYALSVVVAKEWTNEVQGLGELYVEGAIRRHEFWFVTKIFMAVLVILEGLAVVRSTYKHALFYTGIPVFGLLAAGPGYVVAQEFQRRHEFSKGEIAAIKDLFGQHEGRRFVVLGEAFGLPPGAMDVHPASVSTDRYGLATVAHSFTLDGSVFATELQLRYDQITLPELVTYNAPGRTLQVGFPGADSLLLWDKGVNPSGPALVALSEPLAHQRANALRLARDARMTSLRDSLQRMTNEFHATIHGGNCLKLCFLFVEAKATGLGSELLCPPDRVPGGDLQSFVDQASSTRSIWTITTRRTMVELLDGEEAGEWVEREEVLAIVPERPLKTGDLRPEPAVVPVQAERTTERPSPRTPAQGKVVAKVDEPAEFPGGKSARDKFIASTMKYPPAARSAGESGIVLVSITVQADGELENIRVQRSVSAALDQEALRIVGAMPRWEPAKLAGRAVVSKQDVPVRFTIR